MKNYRFKKVKLMECKSCWGINGDIVLIDTVIKTNLKLMIVDFNLQKREHERFKDLGNDLRK